MNQIKKKLIKLQEIHQDTYKFILEDEKIVLTKRLKPQTKHGVVVIPEEVDIIGEKALANQNDIIKITPRLPKV